MLERAMLERAMLERAMLERAVPTDFPTFPLRCWWWAAC
jgi:hypothetical protein